MNQSWVESLVTAQAAGTSLSNSASATSILSAAQKIALPAGFLDVPGKAIRITALGRLSNIVTTPGTLTFEIKFGSTVVFSGGAMQLSTTAHTTLPFWFEVVLTCRAIGSSATLMGQGLMTTACFDAPTIVLAPNTTPTVGNTFDSSASQVVDLFATFSVANAGNLIQVEQFVLESLN